MTTKQRYYEVHLASDVISVRLDAELRKLGFARDAFIGGTTGVVHPCHYTIDPATKLEMESVWEHSKRLLSNAGADEFAGYAEGEITSAQHRIILPWRPYDPSTRFPFEPFEFEECPTGLHKNFDIHVSADLASIDERLKRRLEDDCGFHYVDIRKPNGATVRVYTIQPLGDQVTASILRPLRTFFETAGGLEGKIKLEVCTHFARFPATAAVCPVIRKLVPTQAYA